MELIGKGIYSIPEVSRWTQIPAPAIRRWVGGYRSGRQEGQIQHAPVFVPELSGRPNSKTLSFLDLVELRFINEFRKHGVSWPVIRKTSEAAAKILGTGHPFANRRIYTDTKTIFIRTINEVGGPQLLELFRGQFEMDDIVFPLLHGSLDFGDDDFALKWWPMGRSSEIVLDPARNFGRPIMASARVPTETLYDAFLAEQSIERVAEWFEVDPSLVREAVAFQEHLVA